MQNECFSIEFIDVTSYLNSISDKLPLRHYYSKTTYYRLFIAEMFPEYDKAIYVDSDLVIQGDIPRIDIISCSSLYRCRIRWTERATS